MGTFSTKKKTKSGQASLPKKSSPVFELNGKTLDPRDKILLIQGKKESDGDWDYLTKLLYKAGARLVIFADRDVTFEELQDRDLHALGLTRIPI
jgi:hypothetical protein